MKEDFLLFQINDAAFPIGAYTHSYGLETYILKDYVKNREDVFKYVKSNTVNTFLYTDLLAAYKSYEYAKDNNLKGILEIEEILEASKMPIEIRTASQKLGSRFIKTIDALGINSKKEIWSRYIQSTVSKVHPTAYGTLCYSVGIPVDMAMERYLFSYVSAAVINAVKLIPLSQTEGQQILYKCSDFFEEILEKLKTLDIDDLCISTPGFDIRCMQHERLYSRLYMS